MGDIRIRNATKRVNLTKRTIMQYKVKHKSSCPVPNYTAWWQRHMLSAWVCVCVQLACGGMCNSGKRDSRPVDRKSNDAISIAPWAIMSNFVHLSHTVWATQRSKFVCREDPSVFVGYPKSDLSPKVYLLKIRSRFYRNSIFLYNICWTCFTA